MSKDKDYKLKPQQVQRCIDWARANPSDPFALARAYSDYKNGIAGRGEDYEVEFVTQEKPVLDRSGEPVLSLSTGEPLYATVKVPKTMKKP